GGERAVADALLLMIAQLAERPAEWRIEEHRVVAETAVAARRGRDRPLRDALHRALAAGLVDERDDAAKARGALLARHRAQMRQLAHLPRVQRREDEMTFRGSDALQAEGSLAAGVERAALEPNEASDADAGETQQIVQACPIERRLLGGALDLDEFAGAGHDHVHVHGGAAILYIVQVQDRAPGDD